MMTTEPGHDQQPEDQEKGRPFVTQIIKRVYPPGQDRIRVIRSQHKRHSDKERLQR